MFPVTPVTPELVKRLTSTWRQAVQAGQLGVRQGAYALNLLDQPRLRRESTHRLIFTAYLTNGRKFLAVICGPGSTDAII